MSKNQNNNANTNSNALLKTGELANLIGVSSQIIRIYIKNKFEKLQLAYGDAKFKINDKSSGLNEKRKGLHRIFELARNREITDIAVVREDQLARFGLKYIYEILRQNNVNVHVLINEVDKTDKSLKQEMMDDFMAIIASFSGRFSQMNAIKQN